MQQTHTNSTNVQPRRYSSSIASSIPTFRRASEQSSPSTIQLSSTKAIYETKATSLLPSTVSQNGTTSSVTTAQRWPVPLRSSSQLLQQLLLQLLSQLICNPTRFNIAGRSCSCWKDQVCCRARRGAKRKFHWEELLMLEGSRLLQSAKRRKEEVSLEANTDEEDQAMVGSPETWKLLWNCKVPPKVHYFLWKLMHNILPTAPNLEKKLEETVVEPDMMSFLDVQEMLGLALLGAIPEDSEVIRSTNRGYHLVLNKPPTLAGLSFEQAAWGLVEQDSMQAVLEEEEPKRRGLFSFFGGWLWGYLMAVWFR